ncbi:MAG TPA: O-antigen ligase family protein [Candidatus Dormibacteraeota bacterium]
MARAARFLLLGALIASPTYLVKLHLGSLEPNLLEALVGLGLLAALFGLAARAVRLRSWAMQWPALALFAAGTLALLWSPDQHASFGIYRQYLVEPLLAGYALYLVLRTAGDVWLGAWAVVGSGLVPAVAEMVSAVQHLSTRHTWDVHPPTAFYLNANFAAEMIVPALVVALALALTPQRRTAALACAAVLLVGLAVTYSRGGFFGLAAGLVVLWWLGIQRKLPFAAGGVLAAVLGLALIPRMFQRLLHEFDPHDPNNTVLSREPIWQAAVRMIHDHPLTGIGLNSFAGDLRRYAPDVGESHTHPHNFFLNFWLVLGLLGLAAYLWVIVWFGRVIRRGLVGDLRPLYVGLAAALVAILVHGLVDTTIWRNDLGLQFWVLIAVATAGLER